MNYPTFLSEVDRMSAALDAEALRAFVHELARTFPETERLRLSTTTNQAVCSLLPNERLLCCSIKKRMDDLTVPRLWPPYYFTGNHQKHETD